MPLSTQLDYQRVIVGYHGCDQQVAEKVLLGRNHLKPSNNPWDWLGQGVYFWEFGPQRALDFALEQKQRGKIQEPAVIGAYINLGHCFDLTDISHTNQLAVAYEEWLEIFRASGRQPPTNLVGRGGGDDLLLRHRDCAVLNWYMRLLDQRSTTSYFYQTVRGVFVEGAPVYDGAGIYTKTHVQISVRDSRCILGYFLPSFFFEGGVEEDDND